MIDEGHFALTVDAPERYSRPSIDVAFHRRPMCTVNV